MRRRRRGVARRRGFGASRTRSGFPASSARQTLPSFSSQTSGLSPLQSSVMASTVQSPNRSPRLPQPRAAALAEGERRRRAQRCTLGDRHDIDEDARAAGARKVGCRRLADRQRLVGLVQCRLEPQRDGSLRGFGALLELDGCAGLGSFARCRRHHSRRVGLDLRRGDRHRGRWGGVRHVQQHPNDGPRPAPRRNAVTLVRSLTRFRGW